MSNNNCLRSILGVFIIAAALTIPLISSSFAADQGSHSPQIKWSMDSHFVIPAREVAARGAARSKAELLDPIAAKMVAEGIAVQVQDAPGTDDELAYDVKASSSGTIDEFRRLIHTVMKRDLNTLGGVTEMHISSRGAQSLTSDVVIAANPSTGYIWTVANDSGFTESAPSDFVMHTSGLGVPQHQVLHLRNSMNRSNSIRLIYRRPWESTTSKVRFTLDLDNLPARIDLSDPLVPTNPVAPPAVRKTNASAFPTVTASAFPSSWDWRNSEIVTPIRDQGNCGSCWAFGTVGIMESALWKSGEANIDLSEQYLVSCNTSSWNCDGGLTAHMYHYDRLGKNQTSIGAVLESVKPYTATNGTCSQAYNHPYKLNDWQFITPTEFDMPTVDQIKSAIYTYGPVTAGVCAGSGWNYYTGGVFSTDETSQCGGSTNHQIILVGWNDNGGNGYWILRNSWGTSWGIDGYMYIAYNKSRVGEGISWVTTATASITPTITGISPASLVQGVTDQILTITGTNLTGASIAVSSTDVTLGTATVTDTRITVPVTVASDASTDTRTITVTTASGSSTTTFTITASGATTLFSESFEGTGWATKQVSGKKGAWTIAGSGKHPSALPYDGDWLAGFNSYTSRSGSKTRIYRTSGFAVPASANTVTLKFWMFHDTLYANSSDQIQPQISTNRTKWTNAGTTISRYNGSTGWAEVSVDLSTYKGKTIYLGFLGISAYGNDIYLDDVSVVAQ